MKTPHRIMYEVLTPEELKRFIKNKVAKPLKLSDLPPSEILSCAFEWDKDGEEDFWIAVHDRLLVQGQ